MNEAELVSLRQYLVSQRASILNRSHEFKSEQGESLADSRADESEVASSDTLASIFYRLHERDRGMLMKIDRALGKIANSTFGLCESCGCQISAKRLQARPFAELCIDCQEEQEIPGR